MRILVVHEVNYLSKTIYEFQILPEILSLLGHSVTVVDYNDSWSSERGGAGAWLYRRVYPATHRAYASARISLYRPGMMRVPVLSRISGAFTSLLEVWRLLKHSSFDAVLLYGLPTVGVQTLLAARAFEVPVAFRAIDVTHELVPPALALPTRALEAIVFNNVDLNIALTPLLRNYIQAYGVPDNKMRLLPSGVDTSLFFPVGAVCDRASFLEVAKDARSQTAPTEGPVVLFMGTIYRFSGLDRVIRDWRNLLAVHPGAKLLIVGAGEDQHRLENLAGEVGVASQVIFAGMQPYATLPRLIRSSDVCINPFELNGITEKILPTKLFQYLACGKPVIASKLPGTVPFLSGEEDGVIYAAPENTVHGLIDLLADPLRRSVLGERGVAAVRKYDWTEIARQMASWLGELAANNRNGVA